MQSLMLISLVLLTGCATASNCPYFPEPSQGVADEIETLDEQKYNNLFNWLAKLKKLDEKLSNR